MEEDTSSELNGLFTKMGLQDMLEMKDRRVLDMIFPIFTDFIDLSTGYSEERPITEFHIMYSDLVSFLTG